MEGAGEGLPLLRATQSPPDTDDWSQKLRFFCTITIVLLFFKGGEEMASATRKQYVYAWCEKYVNATPNVTLNNHAQRAVGGECGEDAGSNTTEHKAQVLASKWELYFGLVDATLLFFSVSFSGTLSDYLGRKPFVCLALAGYSVKAGLFAVIIRYNLNIAYMFISYIVDGVCGSSFAFSLFGYTMTADITTGARDRVLYITVMETLISVGRCTTRFGNGYFIKEEGFFYPMLTATIATSLSFLFAIILLKETHAPADNNKRCQNPTISTLFRNYIGFYTGSEKNRSVFWVCFSVFFLLEFAILGRDDVLTLYQLGSPFCWSSETIGQYDGVQMAVCYVLGSLSLKLLQLCLPDNVSTCLGLASAVGFNVVTAIARSTATLFVAIVVGILMILPKSILRGIASSRATGDRQGAMFAGLSSSELVCKLVASPASLAIYANTLTTMKGAVFLALGGVNLVALVMMVSSAKLFRNGR